MKATDRLEKINNAIEAGYTVRISTMTNYSDVNQKVVNRFRKAGYEVFKVAQDSLYMRSGKRWDCIDYCSFTAY